MGLSENGQPAGSKRPPLGKLAIPPAVRCLRIRPTDSLSNPESYAIGFHDPKLTCRRSVGQDQSDPMRESEDGVLVLPLRPKNNDPGILCGRVCPDIGEIQIQRCEDSVFVSRLGRYYGILSPHQALIGNCIGLEASTA